MSPHFSIASVPGDLNGDRYVKLDDSIIGLRVVTARNSYSSINLDSDVNQDGRVGIEEVIYVLQVVAGIRNSTTCSVGFWYDWSCYSLELLSSWGIGNREQEYFHNDKDRDWYIDQADTGIHSDNNCGPSSVTMAAKWYDSTFDKTAEDARNMYRPEGGWWYTSDIINYLNYYNIQNDLSSYQNTQQIAELLNQGCILILCIDTSFIRFNGNSEERTDRFYSYGGGHFLVVKGSRKVDDNLYFEVYDPNNWHAIYNDNTEKGKNRHYRAYDLSQSINNWWNYLIVIYPIGGGGRDLDIWIDKVNPKEIIHMRGK